MITAHFADRLGPAPCSGATTQPPHIKQRRLTLGLHRHLDCPSHPHRQVDVAGHPTMLSSKTQLARLGACKFDQLDCELRFASVHRSRGFFNAGGDGPPAVAATSSLPVPRRGSLAPRLPAQQPFATHHDHREISVSISVAQRPSDDRFGSKLDAKPIAEAHPAATRISQSRGQARRPPGPAAAGPRQCDPESAAYDATKRGRTFITSRLSCSWPRRRPVPR